jgi:phosphotransferase system HPr (HPr) family protein
MNRKTYTIINPTGFHTRPARLFVDTANEQFPDCQVTVIKGDKVINGKSLLHMLTLGVKYQEQVTLEISGEAEDKAQEVLGAFFEAIHHE